MLLQDNLTDNWGIYQSQRVFQYHLHNVNGTTVSITNFGASITRIMVADANGKTDDIVLGYDSLEDYANDQHYMGSLVGRYANRIAGGIVSIDGHAYQLSTKPEGYHHHGGNSGFNKKVWNTLSCTSNSVTMRYRSADGEEGFPGNLNVEVSFLLTTENHLIINLFADTDQPTIINLTHHPYFNLAGHTAGNISSHRLQVNSDKYLPVNEMHVPTGEIVSVKNTPFDFRNEKTIGEHINDTLLAPGKGYDNTLVIEEQLTTGLKIAAKVKEPVSGRMLTVYTTEPSVHFYTGNFLNNVKGKAGAIYSRQGGFCLETQHYPDSPNHPHFPTTILWPGKGYTSTTIYSFETATAGN
ncbi:aldose epimerase family protein [Mucilaginibacter sp. KACC 22063]|uniref:aldose epimerase family protein n=1 Tax=Mucilaginibacter sp. KACC 22063 TaxID=3025666 RepID=UPI0023667EA1|nr:aldose epimerase family protein [Mucilaginibacter sp. KACC 22063]WDF54228.1 galactose mutarotase [Mucilaginibacter sp. KACC 22063]